VEGGGDIRLVHAQHTQLQTGGANVREGGSKKRLQKGNVRIGQQAGGLCSLRSDKRRRRMVAGLHGKARNQHRAMWYPQERCCRSAVQPLLRSRAKGKQWSGQ